MPLSATDISSGFSPASLQLLADALLSAAKQGKTQAEPTDLIRLLLALPAIKKIYAEHQ